MNHSQIHSAITGHLLGSACAVSTTPAHSYSPPPEVGIKQLLLDAREAAALMGISVRLFHMLRPSLPSPVLLSQRAVRWRRSDLETHIAGLPAESSTRPEPAQLMRGRAAKRAASGGPGGGSKPSISGGKSQSQSWQKPVPSNCEKEAA